MKTARLYVAFRPPNLHAADAASLCARLIHQRSARADAPFVEINCSLYSPEEQAAMGEFWLRQKQQGGTSL